MEDTEILTDAVTSTITDYTYTGYRVNDKKLRNRPAWEEDSSWYKHGLPVKCYIGADFGAAPGESSSMRREDSPYWLNKGYVEGRLSKRGDSWYICSNVYRGSSCPERFGYAFSWVLDSRVFALEPMELKGGNE